MKGPHLKQAENGVYYVHWVDGARSKRQSTRCEELPLAEEWFGYWKERRGGSAESKTVQPTVEPAKARPTVEPLGARLTIGALWGHYRDGHVVPKLHARSSIAQSWRQLEPFFGEIVLAELTEADVARYAEHRRRPRVAKVGHIVREIPGPRTAPSDRISSPCRPA